MGWTAYPEIDEMLAALLSGSRAILGDNLFGMYLFGSLASGDFNADTSDIDFVVVVHADIVAATEAELGRLNAQIQASCSPWAAKLEGSFLPLHVFKDFNPRCTMYPTIGMGGRYGLDHKGIEHALQRFLLREDGIALAGPEPRTFIAPVGSEALKAEALDLLHGWWQAQLDDPVRLRRRGYQAYAVVTMCRALHTLETGGMASKPAAARWARPIVPERLRPLIDRALVWRDGDGIDDFMPTMDLIRWVIRGTEKG